MFIAGGMKRLCGPWGMASILTDVLLVARKNNTIVNIMVVHPGISWALTSLSMGILLTVLLANFDCTVHGGVVSACRFCRQRDVLCVMVCMGFFYLRHWAFETMIEVTWMFFAGGGKRLCGSWGMLENFYNMMCVLIADGTYWWQLRGARELLRHDVRFDRQWHLLSVFFCMGFFYVRQWAFETMIEVTWMVIAVCGRRLCGSWGMVFSSSRKYGTHVEKKCHRYCGYRAGSTLHCSINMRKIFHKASADVFENFYDMMCVLIADGTYWWQHYGDMMVNLIFWDQCWLLIELLAAFGGARELPLQDVRFFCRCCYMCLFVGSQVWVAAHFPLVIIAIMFNPCYAMLTDNASENGGHGWTMVLHIELCGALSLWLSWRPMRGLAFSRS